MGELAFPLAVAEHIIGDMLLRLVCPVKIHFALHGEDAAVVFAFRHVVVDGLHNHCGLLLLDDAYNLAYKLFGVVLEQVELARLDALQYLHHCAAGEIGAFGYVAHKVVADGGSADIGQLPGLGTGVSEVSYLLLVLRSLHHHIAELLHLQFGIDVQAGFFY